MANPLDRFLSRFRRRTAPTQTAGVPGTAIYGGFIQDNEKNSRLSSRKERYETYSEILANVSIVAAGTRYFLNLVAKAEWSFVPSEADRDGRFAELAEQSIVEDPQTPWHRIVRRAAMHRFYGFSVQEWTARRHEAGHMTYKDVAPRAQRTIERWDVNRDGTVNGMIQRSPQTSEDLYIPRPKTLYLVDDTIDDSPEGLGLFRHLVSPADRLTRYEQLEGWGYETDLRGIPIGRGPFEELDQQQAAGSISQAERVQKEQPIRDFLQNHIKTPKLALLLDSITYESKDEAGRASSARKWDVELLKGSPTSIKENAEAIVRINMEMARILGVEQLMLGQATAGSFALSKDKTNNFFLMVDGALTEIEEGVEDDLLLRLWQLNGWPEEMMPEIRTEAVRFTDVEEVAAVLRDMATAGAVLEVDDPVIGEVRDLMGVSRPPEVSTMEGDQLTGEQGVEVEGSTDDPEEDMPDDPAETGE